MYEWSEDLVTGVEVVDNQHKKIIEKINNLLDLCEKGVDGAEIDSILDFLADYVTTHFMFEEKLMVQTTYPTYEEHKREHIEFLNMFLQMRRQYANWGISVAVVEEIKNKLVDWLLKHILGSDKTFAIYYRTYK